jgi:hypothetical protein
MPAVAPRGHNRGVFTQIKNETGTDKLGHEYNRLMVTVGLEAKNPEGQPYRVTKTYNLLGRGARKFQEDFFSWTGRRLTDEQLNSFDEKGEMEGKAVVVDISYRQQGSKLVEEIKGFFAAD